MQIPSHVIELPIEVRPLVANERVSYLGTFRIHTRGALRFRISVQPQGASKPFELHFEDRLGIGAPR